MEEKDEETEDEKKTDVEDVVEREGVLGCDSVCDAGDCDKNAEDFVK